MIDLLIKEGYDGENIPEDKNLTDLFIESGALNNAKYTNVGNFKGKKWEIEEYLTYFNRYVKLNFIFAQLSYHRKR